jgi:GcrA cell cycle regulator
MSWNDERVELLRKLWLDGKSASQIAAELANGITRNAVIGKVHRLGLSTRIKTQASSAPRPRPRPMAPRPAARSAPPPIRGSNALALDLNRMRAVLPEPIESVVVSLAENVTIMELREAMCRWPIGDPSNSEFRFCGSKSSPGASYCGHHSRLAYQPPQDRRRERDRERRLQKMM